MLLCIHCFRSHLQHCLFFKAVIDHRFPSESCGYSLETHQVLTFTHTALNCLDISNSAFQPDFTAGLLQIQEVLHEEEGTCFHNVPAEDRSFHQRSSETNFTRSESLVCERELLQFVSCGEMNCKNMFCELKTSEVVFFLLLKQLNLKHFYLLTFFSCFKFLWRLIKKFCLFFQVTSARSARQPAGRRCSRTSAVCVGPTRARTRCRSSFPYRLHLSAELRCVFCPGGHNRIWTFSGF